MAGYVFKRANQKHWSIRYDGIPDVNGKRTQKWESCKGLTKPEAEKRLAERIMQVEHGTLVTVVNQTFREYILEWLDRAKNNIAATTFLGYKRNIHNHLIPEFGNISLSKLKPEHIQKFYDKLLDKETLSAKTVRNIHGVLRKSLQQALKLQQIKSNPADVVELPRYIKPIINCMPMEAVGTLLNAIENNNYRIPILIALYTGMRRGEVLGLQWSDLNIESHTLCVRRSIYQVPGGVYAKEPKTRHSRVVCISESLIEELIKHKESQKKQGIATMWICAKDDGELQTPGGLSHAFEKIQRDYKFDFTLHSLRHMQATELLNAGISVKAVSERLGHSTSQMTTEIYAHVLPHIQQKSADIVEKLIKKKA